jgi:phosphoglycerate dehydrogenase-like enzyme
MTEVAVLSGNHVEYRDELDRRGFSVVMSGPAAPQSVLPPVLLADPNLIAQCDLSAIQWIQSTWAGVDSVDWQKVPDHIVIAGLPGVFGRQMREFVFAHLLAATHRTDRLRTAWDTTPPGSLAGARLGLLGAGSIAGDIAELGRAFGMVVTGCSRSGLSDPRYEQIWPVSEIGDFARDLDHLVAVLPATDDTRHLIDRDLLSRLGRGATFINVGRGSTAVTDDVVDMALSGHLSRVVLDVTDPEPLPADHRAWAVPNVVITGHTAALSRPIDVVDRFVENLRRYEAGEPLIGVIDRTRGY